MIQIAGTGRVNPTLYALGLEVGFLALAAILAVIVLLIDPITFQKGVVSTKEEEKEKDR